MALGREAEQEERGPHPAQAVEQGEQLRGVVGVRPTVEGERGVAGHSGHAEQIALPAVRHLAAG
jgi:hypothetical protein